MDDNSKTESMKENNQSILYRGTDQNMVNSEYDRISPDGVAQKLKKDCLKGRHPLALLMVFAALIGISMFSGSPVVMIIMTIGSLTVLGILKGSKSLISHMKLMAVLAVLTAAINPLFNHRGRTVLAKFRSGNALTFEAVMYGLYAALILISVISWFACFNYVFDSDKLLYLFGGFSPALALVLSMTLHFVPEFTAKAREISLINKGNTAANSKGLVKKLRNKMAVFGALLTWALEGSVKKAKSMRDRGYGSRKRSRYSIFRWKPQDSIMTAAALGLTAFYIILHILGAFKFWFYPVLYGKVFSVSALCGYSVIICLCLLPVLFNFRHLGRTKEGAIVLIK